MSRLAFAPAAVVVVGRGAAGEAPAASLLVRPSSGSQATYAGDRLIGQARHAPDDFGPPRRSGFASILRGDRGFDLAQLGPGRLGGRGRGLGDDGRRAVLALLLGPDLPPLSGPVRAWTSQVGLVACGMRAVRPRRSGNACRRATAIVSGVDRDRSRPARPAALAKWRTRHRMRRSGLLRQRRAGPPPSRAA